mgnify:CR=1 FL=1
MKKIFYTEHLYLRLKIRNFSEDYPKLIYQYPEQKFFDNLEKINISIKRLKYNEKLRNIMIAYHENEDVVSIITIHPISDEKIFNRLLSGRWSKNG